MNKPGKTGVAHFIDASKYTWLGLKAAFQHESGFRQELALVLLFAPAAFWVGETPTQMALLLMSCLIVLIVELLNSAIEAVVDRIGPEHHELSGRAKDMGSAAVCLALCQCGICYALIGYQHFF